jgi:hypothetical protein
MLAIKILRLFQEVAKEQIYYFFNALNKVPQLCITKIALLRQDFYVVCVINIPERPGTACLKNM